MLLRGLSSSEAGTGDVLGKTGDLSVLPKWRGRAKEESGEYVAGKEVKKEDHPQGMVAHQC